MKPDELLDILGQAGKLKTTYRHCFLKGGRQESVADHSFRIALFAMLLSKEEAFRSDDMDRVIRMCLIHDLGESFTGDIPAFLKTDGDADKEDRILDRWVDGFTEPQRAEWQGLLSEMNELSTREARIYKAIDKLEALISHNKSDLSTWLPLEYDLQLTYGQENMEVSPYFQELREVIDAWTRRKIETEK